MTSSHLILCRPLFLLPPVPPNIRVFSSESTLCMRWPKYWSFSFSIRPSKEHPGLISFRMDWLDLPAVQGILKSLLQHHNSKASILRYSAFFTVQLSHPYYSAIKRNVFESVLMRWMNLEPITQSEVSQKEKDTLHLYIYIESIKMILMIPLKYSWQTNPIDRGAWWATVHGVTTSWAWLNDWAQTQNNIKAERAA